MMGNFLSKCNKLSRLFSLLAGIDGGVLISILMMVSSFIGQRYLALNQGGSNSGFRAGTRQTTTQTISMVICPLPPQLLLWALFSLLTYDLCF